MHYQEDKKVDDAISILNWLRDRVQELEDERDELEKAVESKDKEIEELQDQLKQR